MIWALLVAIVWAGSTQAASIPVTVTFQAAAPPIKVGETTILATPDGGNGNLLLAQGPYALTQAAVPQSLSFWVGAASGNLRLGIFDATGPSGGPGALVGQTNSFVPTTGWNTESVTASPTMQPGNYWLAYTPSSSSLAFRKGGGVTSKWYNRTFDSLPATFSTTPISDPFHWSLYATLAATGPPPPPLDLVFNPANPSIACSAPPGSFVSAISATGAQLTADDKRTVLMGTTGQLTGTVFVEITGGDGADDFALSSGILPSNVIVGPSGIAVCNTTKTVIITPSQ